MCRQNALPGPTRYHLESKPLLTAPACQKEPGTLTHHPHGLHQSLFWNAQSRFSLCLKSEGPTPPSAGGQNQGGLEPWTAANTIIMACRDCSPEGVPGPSQRGQPLDGTEKGRPAANWELICCEQRRMRQGRSKLKRRRSRQEAWVEPGVSPRQGPAGTRNPSGQSHLCHHSDMEHVF